jgi:hypothetical protein
MHWYQQLATTSTPTITSRHEFRRQIGPAGQAMPHMSHSAVGAGPDGPHSVFTYLSTVC